MIKFLIVLHRWLGVALCVLFLLWFPSGIGMMYWGMPAVTARDRLARAPAFDPSTIVLSPREAAERLDASPAPGDIRLGSFDGRPVYRIGGAGGGRIVYADTGDVQGDASHLLRRRVAAAWTGQPAADATVTTIGEPDQWLVGSQLRNLRPLWKHSWPNGEDVYIGASGEVLQYTTPTTRLQAYLSAVPHWLYFTPLRKHQPVWIRFATYTAMIGAVGAIIGVVLGAWLYSPRKGYRHAGLPSRIPYRGQKRWHTILGLVFGVATVTWTVSGSLAFLPFPPSQPAPSQAQARPAQAPDRPPQGQRAGRRGGATAGPAAALRGRIGLDDIDAVHPRQLLAQHADLGIRELSYTSFDGEPHYSAALADGTSRLFSLDGRIVDRFDRDRIVAIVRRSLPDPGAAEFRTVDRYDYYYQDRTGQRPLPVLLVLTHDEVGTRYYIDPKTATASTYSDRNWARRFFYSGLHSLNFPWLYNHRPLWDIVVITFMVGGTALCGTALVLAWRAVGKKLRQVARQARPEAAAVG